jgi:hypothetical protein
VTRVIGGIRCDPTKAGEPLSTRSAELRAAIAAKCQSCRFWSMGDCPITSPFVGNKAKFHGQPFRSKTPVQWRYDDAGNPICSMFVHRHAEAIGLANAAKATLRMFEEPREIERNPQ